MLQLAPYFGRVCFDEFKGVAAGCVHYRSGSVAKQQWGRSATTTWPTQGLLPVLSPCALCCTVLSLLLDPGCSVALFYTCGVFTFLNNKLESDGFPSVALIIWFSSMGCWRHRPGSFWIKEQKVVFNGAPILIIIYYGRGKTVRAVHLFLARAWRKLN